MSLDTQTFQRLVEVRRYAEATRHLAEHAKSAKLPQAIKAIGTRIGSSDGIIISLIAAMVSMSTAFE